jgi:disulfide bond formation protein DsbB
MTTASLSASRRLPKISWPFFAAAASLLMLGGAHAFETFGRYPPCDLCLVQRDVYWAALVTAGVAVVFASAQGEAPLRRVFDALLGAIFLGGAAVAAYHAGVEWKWWPGPAACTGARSHVTAADMARVLSGVTLHLVRCDEAAWRLFGVSMAGWNALISLVLAGASFSAATSARRTGR